MTQKRFLVIDDEPVRAQKMVRAGHFVAIAHTYDQIRFWLKNGPWDQIILDHDLSMPYDGRKVCEDFGLGFLYFGCQIRIWSMNLVAAPQMRSILLDIARHYDLDADVIVLSCLHDVEV